MRRSTVYRTTSSAKSTLSRSLCLSRLLRLCSAAASPIRTSSTSMSIFRKWATASVLVLVAHLLCVACTRIASSISRCKRISCRSLSSIPCRPGSTCYCFRLLARSRRLSVLARQPSNRLILVTTPLSKARRVCASLVASTTSKRKGATSLPT